jgi:molecular chaperone GrpE
VRASQAKKIIISFNPEGPGLSDHHRKQPAKKRRTGDETVQVAVEGSNESTSAEKALEENAVVTIPVQHYEELKTQVEELKDRYLRTAADFENFRKRSEKERENIVCYANEKLISDLLPILDNLERALTAVPNGTNLESILEGVHMVSKNLHSVLGACGLEPVRAIGTPFDPQIHEAVGVLPSEQHDEGTVMSEIQKGYRLKGKVLRHSIVHVAGQPGNGSGGEER